MKSLAERLPEEIKRLEEKYGSDNKFVQDLKAQLEEIQSGIPTEEVWFTQVINKKPELKGIQFVTVEEVVQLGFGGESLVVHPSFKQYKAGKKAKRKRNING